MGLLPNRVSVRSLTTCLVLSACTAKMTYPMSDVIRFLVPQDKVDWSVPYAEYSPRYYDAPRLIGNKAADVPLKSGKFAWNTVDGSINRKSFEGDYRFDEDGYPLNPRGRTGLRGRGLLYYWGPNHAADPIVTRWKRDRAGEIITDELSKRSVLQLIVIKRGDNGMWALPGGMVDKNEKAHSAAVREFLEEATNSGEKSDVEKQTVLKNLNELFSNGVLVYRGYVGDPRNTDNAWIETSAFNFHDESGDAVNSINLMAGDDAKNVTWQDVSKNMVLHATHLDFVKEVAVRKQSHW